MNRIAKHVMLSLILQVSIISLTFGQDLSDKVAGNYAAYKSEDYQRGIELSFPRGGVSHILRIDALYPDMVLVTETYTVRGRSTSNSYKAYVYYEDEKLLLKEKWEYGELETDGVFKEDKLQLNYIRRSDGKLVERRFYSK